MAPNNLIVVFNDGQDTIRQQTLDSFPFGAAACHNRAVHKWTYVMLVNYNTDVLECDRYDDFQKCFTLWCKKEPHGAEGILNTIS